MKILLQGLIGTLLTIPILPYNTTEIFNLKQVDSLLIMGWILYEFILIFISVYIWIVFVIFILLKKVIKKNSILINIAYFGIIYYLYSQTTYNGFNFYSLGIMCMLGIINFFCIRYFFKEIKTSL